MGRIYYKGLNFTTQAVLVLASHIVLVAEHHVNQKFLKSRSFSSNYATGPFDPIGLTA